MASQHTLDRLAKGSPLGQSGAQEIGNAANPLGATAASEIGFWGADPIVQPADADQAAVAAPTAYEAHASGATPVTSNAATDLDTTAAALATAVSELAALTTLVTAMRTAMVDAGLMKGAA